MDVTQYRTEIQQLIQKIQDNRGKDLRATIECCDQLEKYGHVHSDDALIGFACFTRGESYYQMNDMANFYHEMLMCMEPLERIHEWGYLAMADNMLGIMSLNRGNAPFAMDYYMKAMHYCQEYRLPDLEWMVHMNLGALYLNVEDPDNAILHYEAAYQYIHHHPDLSDRASSLTAVCIGLGKAELFRGNLEKARDYAEKIEKEWLNGLFPQEKEVVYCFEAQMYHELGDIPLCEDRIMRIRMEFTDQIPIMDVFDDFYDYLKMLLEIKRGEEFFAMYALLEPMVKQTTIKNLEKKLLELKIRFYHSCGDEQHYRTSAVEYFKLSQMTEQENKMMISNMIALRSTLHHLAQINRRVEKENKALQNKAETDPLTNMSNRLRLNQYGEEVMERCQKNRTGLAVEILDIDFFKEFNDNYGHQAGDKCIRFIADSISTLRKYPGIFTARYGGDEFVVIYEGYTDREVFAMAKDLKAKIVGANYEHKYSRTKTKIVTISQGIFWGIPNPGDTMWNYLHSADNLLYKVKSKSRNSIMLGHSIDGEGSQVEEDGKGSFAAIPKMNFGNIEDEAENQNE